MLWLMITKTPCQQKIKGQLQICFFSFASSAESHTKRRELHLWHTFSEVTDREKKATRFFSADDRFRRRKFFACACAALRRLRVSSYGDHTFLAASMQPRAFHTSSQGPLIWPPCLVSCQCEASNLSLLVTVSVAMPFDRLPRGHTLVTTTSLHGTCRTCRTSGVHVDGGSSECGLLLEHLRELISELGGN